MASVLSWDKSVTMDRNTYAWPSAGRSLGKTEKQYASYQGEMRVVVWAVRSLRQYLHGVHFTLLTDHSPLTTLMAKKDLQGQHLRWAISLQEFSFTVKYRPGVSNANADVSSRWCMYLALNVPEEEVTRPETLVANFCQMMIAQERELAGASIPRWSNVAVETRMGPPLESEDSATGDKLETASNWSRVREAVWRCVSKHQWVPSLSQEGTPAVYDKGTRSPGQPWAVRKLDTRTLSPDFFQKARQQGATCYEPCGGMCAGLEMLLRNGVKVNKYLYQDVSEHSKRVVSVRCAEMVRRYPAQLRAGALSLEVLPDEMKLTTRDMLIQQGALTGEQWVLICGYPCQDLSLAGKQDGLDGKHSRLFYVVVRVTSMLQQLQPLKPPAYISENVSPLSAQQNSRISKEAFPHIARIVGQPVSSDVAQLGSHAHRLRAYLSNLHDKAQFDSLMQSVERPPNSRWVKNVIGEGWEPREVRNSDRDDRAGTVVSKDGTGRIREVDLDEKARAMGYSADVLRRSGLSDMELQVVLGLAMDRRAMEALYAVSEAGTAAWLSHSSKFAAEQSAAVGDCSWDGICQRLVKEAAKDRRGLGQEKPSPHAHAQRRRTWQLEQWRPSQYKARVQTTFVRARGAKEPHIEIPEWAPAERVAPAMRLPALKDTVRFTQLTANLMEQQSQREQCRNVHTDLEGELYLITANVKEVRVPKPEDRLDLMKEYHERTGHWGCKRTEHMLCPKHW
ncbi:hypothetical protein CYMTET_40875 [Cymbomonas tetramitiformis]|uniref:Reverse transcriptase RNase H-like domain-containing protein n=1 Tax=Cymbomonas tetramitiformis TaxID=36881 RepID=A0AAE0C8Z0_9CHLO|nr:hypothetical protein CYMTET_40875 [Cymbomonas tetramitiformis]